MTSFPISRRAAMAGAASALPFFALPAWGAAPVERASALLDKLAWGLLALQPAQATELGVDTGAHAAMRGQLDDRSPQGAASRRRYLADALRALRAMPRGGLDPALQTSLAVAESAFGTALEGMALPYGDVAIGGWRNTPYAVIQNVGGWLDVPQLLDGSQPVHNGADAEAYLARLAAAPALLDGETARIRAARGKGLVPPDFLLDKALAGMGRSLAEAAAANGPYLGPLLRKAKDIPGDWQARAERLVREGIAPALERQMAELRAQRALAKGDAGILRRPHGEQWYAWGLRASTTTRRSAQDLHRMGVTQLRELHVRMDDILKSLGLTQGSVAERTAALQKRPDMAFPDNDEGRAQIVAAMQASLDGMRARLPQAFRHLARGQLEIRRMPLAEEPGAPAAYGGPGAIDGSIPGKIWVNLGDTSLHNRVTIPDLVFHEGLPGHVWQGEYAQALPLLRSMLAFNAYSEGWALYAEDLADELGLYDHDPAGRLGWLMGLSWRAVRLVVDTGLHAMGWSREKALVTFMEATGLPRAGAESEVDRYCAWPGQACGYKVGETEILTLRAKAKAALGARYDLRDFNQAVVDGGNVPLDVLGANVARYVAAHKAMAHG